MIKDNKRTIYELLTLANVQKGSCIQCGVEGHMMNNEACALRDRILVDKPCAMCGQGLHSADDCLKVYQRGYKTQQGHQEGQVHAEPLNGE